MCSTHKQWRDSKVRHPDSYYERKLFAGSLQPAADYLSPSELHATLNGRDRGDGRRIDQFVSGEGCGFEEPTRRSR